MHMWYNAIWIFMSARREACFFVWSAMPSSNVRYQFASERIKQRKRLRGMYSRCPMCGVELDWKHPYLPNSAEVDEIIPISRLPKEIRGRAAVDPSNLQVLCRACNKKKGNKMPVKQVEPTPHEPIKTSRKW